MSTWYYYDKNGRKQGPVTGGQLKGLTKAGVIAPETIVETETGKTVPAKKVQGLTFVGAAQSDVQLESSVLAVAADNPFVADAQQKSGSTVLPVPDSVQPVPVPVAPDTNEQNLPSLSRAVFIFLAVFVGIFGVHDFYARRKRQGRIHLWLLSPWMLLVSILILAVFVWTLYAWSYSPLRKEIQKCEQEIKDCKKEIEETEQKLRGARAGGQREPRKPPNVVRAEPRGAVPPRQPEPQNQPDVDRELVRELEEILGYLQQIQMSLESELSGLRLQRGVLKMTAWAPVGSLWLYFLFFVLPFVSWVMAMVEIIYVTKDGTGKEFVF